MAYMWSTSLSYQFHQFTVAQQHNNNNNNNASFMWQNVLTNNEADPQRAIKTTKPHIKVYKS